VIIYGVVDDALSPDFPLGVDLRCSSGAKTPSGSSRRCMATIPSSRRSSGLRSASSRGAGTRDGCTRQPHASCGV